MLLDYARILDMLNMLCLEYDNIRMELIFQELRACVYK